MKVAELREFAAERGIPLRSQMRKSEIIELLESNVVEVEANVIEESSTELIPRFTIDYQVGKINVDFSELKDRLTKFKDEYVNWKPNINNKDELETVKAHRLYVSEQRTLFADSVKQVKDAYGLPLKEFREEAKEVSDMLEEVYRMFKDVEDEASNIIREQNRAYLEDTYIAYAGVLADVVDFEKVLEKKWLPKSYGLKKAEEELYKKVDAIVSDWNTLKSLDIEGKKEAEAYFFNCLNLNDSIAYAQKLTSDKKRIEELTSHVDREPAESTVRVERIAREPVRPIPISQKKPTSWVMIINSATDEQCREIGKFCGSMGITGKFISGSVDEQYLRRGIYRG